MEDSSKTNQELIAEISLLKNRIRELEQTTADKIGEEYEPRAGQLAALPGTSVRLASESDLEALRESAVRLLSLLDNSNTVIFLKDLEGRYITVNRRYEELFHVTRQTVVGKSDDDLFPREYADRFRQHDLLAMEKGGLFEVEELVPHDDGLHTYISAKFPLFGIDGKPYAVCGIATDITERKQAEKALLESKKTAQRLAQESELIAEIGRIVGSTLNIEDVYERFAEKVRELIPFDRIAVNTVNMKDYTRTIAYVNGDRFSGHRMGEAHSLAGTGLEQIIRTKSSLLVNQKNREAIIRKFPGIIAHEFGAQSTMIIPLISKDEVIGSMAVHSAQRDAYSEKDLFLAERVGSQIAGAIVNAQLFLERKRVEGALLESEKAAKRLAQESELIAEIGRIIGSTLNIAEVYERFAEKVRELIPFDRIAVNTINVKDHTRTTRYVKGDKFADDRTGEVLSFTGTRTEQVVRTKSSLIFSSMNSEDMLKKFPGMLSVQFGAQSTMIIPLISKDEVIGTMALHSAQKDAYAEKDLSLAERVGSQIAGAIANAQLFLERKQAAEERQNLKERLHRAEKMEALGNLAGGVAHDLNNVLGVLSGYSELLVERLPADNPLREYATHILKSSEKGAAIIQDLLTLARRGVVVAQVVDLNGVIANLLATPEFGRLKDYHPQVKIQTDLEKDLPKIKGSPVHLEKTVLNLVSNAAEAITGSGEVTVRTENRYLDKAIRGYDTVEEGDYVVLTVSDTGGGIPTADLGKIFEPFYTKKSMGRSGTGLGLAIVWGTVKDHQGYIDVESLEGGGTTFTLYFPVTRREMSEDAQKIPVEQYMGAGESVLVVDDVQEQRQVASTLLIRLGYQVNAVSSGEEAVDYLRKNQADILVLDMIMEPGIDGLETYKRVIEINPHQRVIIVSGFSETDRVKEAQELGAGAYIKKPYLMEKVGVAIRDELARKRLGE